MRKHKHVYTGGEMANVGYDHGFPGGPSHMEEDGRSPWGNVAQQGFHQQAYPDTITIMTLVMAASIKDPMPFIRAMMPMVGFNGETFSIDYWTSNISAFGPYAPGAPLEEVHVRRSKYQGVMTGFGKQYRLDEDVYQTPIEEIYRKMHMKQLLGGMQYTFLLLIMRALLGCPDIHAVHNALWMAAGKVKRQIIRDHVSQQEKLTGCLSQRLQMNGVDRLSSAVDEARSLIENRPGEERLEANYIIVPDSCVRIMKLELAKFASVITEERAGQIATYVNGAGGLIPDSTIDWGVLLNETEHPIFAGLKTHGMGRVQTDEGSGDLMESTLVVNRYTMWSVDKACEVQIYDADQRTMCTIWKSSDARYPVGMTCRRDKGGAGAGYIIAMTQTVLRTKAMIVGRSHSDTAALLVGVQRRRGYRQEEVRGEVFHIYFRAAVALFKENAHIVIPDAEFVSYLHGARTTIKVIRKLAKQAHCIYYGNGSYLAVPGLYASDSLRPVYGNERAQQHDVWLYAIPAHIDHVSEREPDDVRFDHIIATSDSTEMRDWMEVRKSLIAEVKAAKTSGNADDVLAGMGLLKEWAAQNPGVAHTSTGLVERRDKLPAGMQRLDVEDGKSASDLITVNDVAPTEEYEQAMERIFANQVVHLGGYWQDPELRGDPTVNFFPLHADYMKNPPVIKTAFQTKSGLTSFDADYQRVCICF